MVDATGDERHSPTSAVTLERRRVSQGQGTKTEKTAPLVVRSDVRFLLVAGLVILAAPNVGAQSQVGTGHLTIDVAQEAVHLDAPGDYVLEMWINMTIECDAGNQRFAFPRIDAAPTGNASANWNVDPTSFVADGPFWESSAQFGQPMRYEYVYQRFLHIVFLGGAEENGTTALTWDSEEDVQSVATVPPSCRPEGFRWVVDRAETLNVSHVSHAFEAEPRGRFVDRGEESRMGPNQAHATESPVFQGESRFPDEAFTFLAGLVLLAVALIGWFGRPR